MKQLYLPFKRCADIIGGTLIGLVTLPLVLCLAMLRTVAGRGAFKAIEIVGRHNKTVSLNTFLDKELTSGICASGRWSRMTWWLPLVWNIVDGQISFIGPRMLTSDEMSPAGNDQLYLHLSPGITGWGQIKGDAAPAEQIGMDQAYMMTANPVLDLKILAGTLIKLMRGS